MSRAGLKVARSKGGAFLLALCEGQIKWGLISVNIIGRTGLCL